MDSFDLVEEHFVPVHRLSEKGAVRVGQMLVAKHGLTGLEIVSSLISRHKGEPTKTPFLDAQINGDPFNISIGSNPYVQIDVVEKE